MKYVLVIGALLLAAIPAVAEQGDGQSDNAVVWGDCIWGSTIGVRTCHQIMFASPTMIGPTPHASCTATTCQVIAKTGIHLDSYVRPHMFEGRIRVIEADGRYTFYDTCVKTSPGALPDRQEPLDSEWLSVEYCYGGPVITVPVVPGACGHFLHASRVSGGTYPQSYVWAGFQLCRDASGYPRLSDDEDIPPPMAQAMGGADDGAWLFRATQLP